MRPLVAIKLLLTALAIISCQHAISQDNNGLASKIVDLPARTFRNLNTKAQKLESKINRQTLHYLSKLEKQERKLRMKLARKDSAAATQLFGDIKNNYARLASKLKQSTAGSEKLNEFYSAHLDSISTTLDFLQRIESVNIQPEVKQKIETALSSYKQLQQRIVNTQDIRRYLKERQQLLQARLREFGLAKELQGFKKQAYYYKAQMEEYKTLLSDPTAMEKKLLQLASKTDIFKNFFNKYSQLATMFNLQVEPGSMSSLQGLQTRSQTQQLLQQRIGAAGMNVQQAVQTNITDAQTQLAHLKEKLNSAEKGSSEDDMPDFKPNQQKTKRFLDRLEFGSNIQSARSTIYFPTTTDIGLSVGYKLNDKSVIGIGGSYKLGLGNNWNHIALTHQGVGFRTFADVKLKGSFWATGGGELNYRSQFHDLSVFNNYSAWQKSALLGISKKYNIGKKFRGNAQLLYDFLHSRQVPATQPVIFRLGYNLK